VELQHTFWTHRRKGRRESLAVKERNRTKAYKHQVRQTQRGRAEQEYTDSTGSSKTKETKRVGAAYRETRGQDPVYEHTNSKTAVSRVKGAGWDKSVCTSTMAAGGNTQIPATRFSRGTKEPRANAVAGNAVYQQKQPVILFSFTFRTRVLSNIIA